MPYSKKTAERRQYRSVQRECPTIPNTKMPRENSVILSAIQEWEKTGASLIRLARYHAGFCGISPPLESLWPIIRGDSGFSFGTSPPLLLLRIHTAHIGSTRALRAPRAGGSPGGRLRNSSRVLQPHKILRRLKSVSTGRPGSNGHLGST